MAPAQEFHQPLPSVAVWEAYDPQVRTNLASCALILPEAVVLIDPIRLAEDALRELTAEIPISAIVLTNGNHFRAAAYYQQRFQVPIHACADAAADLDQVHSVQEGDVIARHLAVVELPGAGPGEIAVYCPLDGGTVCMGDALIHLDATGFAFLPDKYCSDARLMRQSLQKLLELTFENMTFAHGLPLMGNAATRLQRLLQA